MTGGPYSGVEMHHDALGHWIAEAGIPPALPAAEGRLGADVLVVGGGYTGLWSAWWIKQLAPEVDVALVESRICGLGPSGRNGGFCNSLWFSLPTLRERFGDQAAIEICEAAADSVATIGRWCEQNGVDAHYRRGGYLQASAAEAQDGGWSRATEACRELGLDAAFTVLDAAGARARCDSPAFRGGIHYADAATVQPALLAFGLRDRVAAAGVRIYENTPLSALKVREGRVEARFPGGTFVAERAVLAAGSQMRTGRSRRDMTLTTSHMVVSEPVPELIEQLGWSGGEAVTDSRSMIHYFRTTHDGRIAFGWGGGRIVFGSRVRPRSEVDPRIARDVVAHLLRFFPQLEGKRIERAWGGPIDVSPTHLPSIRSDRGRIFSGFGYTGNGVGPSQMIARSLASLALELRDPPSRLAFIDPPRSPVPPEPFRYVGGSAIRRALLRKERLEEEGRAVDAATRLISGIPERIGFHVGR